MSSRLFNAGWLVGAALLSSWAVSSASDQAPGRRPAGIEPQAHALPALSVDIDAQVSRLAARSRHLTAAPGPARNLFEFAAPARPRQAAALARDTANLPSPHVTPTEAAAEAPAAPMLSGMADMAGTWTAVISFHDELHYVKRGDVLAGRYRIDLVGADGVDVFDLTRGTILRLRLQS